MPRPLIGCLLLAGLVLAGAGRLQARIEPSAKLAKSLQEYWAGMLHRAIWVLKDSQMYSEYDDLARDLVRFRNQEKGLDRTSIRDGDHVEMRHGIDRCLEEMEKRSTSVLTAISQAHYVGYQIATGRFSDADRKAGRQVMRLCVQLNWLWRRNETDALRAFTIAGYPETKVRSYWNSRLNDLIDFYYRFLHLRGEPFKIYR